MDYKEKVIALLNSQELSKEQKEKLENIFPELKESEDEKIRKELIFYFQEEIPRCSIQEHADKMKEFIAWLKKQNSPAKLSEEEQNRFAKGVLASCALSFIDYLDAHKFEDKMCVSNMECEDIENSFHNAMWDRLHRYYCKYIEKQGEHKSYAFEIMNEKGDFDNGFTKMMEKEQKPTDKVKPKFKVGDWVVVDDGRTGRIIECTTDFADIDLEFSCLSTRVNNIRSWTIQDAKDGDVLHSIGWDNDCIFIFNGLDNWKSDEPNGDRAVATGYCGLFVSADKMEFGMQGPDCIEVNTVKPATKIQRDLLFQKMKDAGYEWDAEHRQLKKIEQNPAWSDEDEKMKKYYLAMLDWYTCSDLSKVEEVKKWIDSLKDRVQPKQEWSEDDEQLYNDLSDTYFYNDEDYPEETYKRMLKKVLDWMTKHAKFLRPQNRWKPSDEQMNALLKLEEMHVLEHEKNQENAHLYMVVKSIIEQLRKLREE